MSAAREEILARIRTSLRDVPRDEEPDHVIVPRDYRRRDAAAAADADADADAGAAPGPSELVTRLEQRLLDYHAQVRRVAAAAVGSAVSEACRERGLRRVVVPRGLPDGWRPSGVEVIEDRGLSAQELDRVDAAVTGCAAAIAETGTLVLDGREVSGRRVITLVPDHHICVLTPDQVLGLVPEAIARLETAVSHEGVPVTLVSGPSASSDIELSRVEGVHGPRNLLVLIAQ